MNLEPAFKLKALPHPECKQEGLMTVAQWISLPSCQTIQESDLAATNLWIGHQGITGIAKFQIQSTQSEIVITLELADSDTDYLEIQVSPDLLRLSGIRYEAIPSNTPDDTEADALDQYYQPRLFRDLIPLPQAVVPDIAIASLNGPFLKITLPVRQETEIPSLASLYSQPTKLPILSAQALDRVWMSDLLVPGHW
jgi:HSP20 family molecular chaperone IbpA